MLLFLVGLLVTIPLTMFAYVLMYERLAAHAAQAGDVLEEGDEEIIVVEEIQEGDQT